MLLGLFVGVVAVSSAFAQSNDGQAKRDTKPTPDPRPETDTDSDPEQGDLRQGRSDTERKLFVVPEATYDEQLVRGWKKTGRAVYFDLEAQRAGAGMGIADTTTADFFATYGAPSLYWSDLNQWEWLNAPIPLVGSEKDRRARAYERPEFVPR